MLEIYLPAVFLSNGIAVALCLNILISYSRQIHSSSFDERVFLGLCGATIVQAVTETIVYSLDGVLYPGVHALLYFLSSVNFCLSSVISLMFVLYIDYKLFADPARIKKHLPFLCIPVAAAFIFTVVNLFVPIFFYITENNVYQRGPYILFSFAQVYIYIIYALVMSLGYQRRQKKYMFMPVLLYVLPVYVGSLLQLVMYGMSSIWVCEALGLTAVYINLQNETSYLDSLTGLYNRTYLFKYLEGVWKKRGNLEGLMLDLNGFKQVNDTYGHAEGDEALRIVGKLLLGTVPRGCVAARYAGDEFVIVIPEHVDISASDLKASIEQAVEVHNRTTNKPYKILFSIGACEHKVETIDEFFSVMDKEMYREKHSFYVQAGHNRRASDRR